MLLLAMPVVANDSIPTPLTDYTSQENPNTPSTDKPQSNAIDAKIEYTSSDSMVITGAGIAYLFGSSELKYKNMELKAEEIRVHMDSSTIHANGVLDTIENEWIGKPVFAEGNDQY